MSTGFPSHPTNFNFSACRGRAFTDKMHHCSALNNSFLQRNSLKTRADCSESLAPPPITHTPGPESLCTKLLLLPTACLNRAPSSLVLALLTNAPQPIRAADTGWGGGLGARDQLMVERGALESSRAGKEGWEWRPLSTRLSSFEAICCRFLQGFPAVNT